jgi:L-tyrosine isonitrile desaturase/decarboxylase
MNINQNILPSNSENLAQFATEMVSDARVNGLALAKNVNFDRNMFASFVNHAGVTSMHTFGSGSAQLFELNASKDTKKIVTGTSSLPLHTDGTFVDTNPSFIILFCHKFNQPSGSGLTQVCLQKQLLELLPRHLSQLFEYNWEYNVLDKSHFPTITEEWISKPSIITKPSGKKCMNIALGSFVDYNNPGWRVRIPELGNESNSLLRELEDFIKKSKAYYEHTWEEGDLLVLDNTEVLHGRNTIAPEGERILFRGQINEK